MTVISVSRGELTPPGNTFEVGVGTGSIHIVGWKGEGQVGNVEVHHEHDLWSITVRAKL